MFHQVARTHTCLAFRTWAEGAALFHRLARALPGLSALVIMPNHVHVLTGTDCRRVLAAALSGHARALNHARGWSGPVWQRLPEPTDVTGDKIWRNERYIHLNPVRAGLVSDPLEWPLSSYLDALGLAVDPIRRRVQSPERYHAYTSSDPSVAVEGTDLPAVNHATPSPEAVLRACSYVLREPMERLHVPRSRLRELALQSLRALTPANGREIADLVGVGRGYPCRVPRMRTPDVKIVERVCLDPRVTPLIGGDLRWLPRWRRFRDWE